MNSPRPGIIPLISTYSAVETNRTVSPLLSPVVLPKFRPGNWVEVRTNEEILATLDAEACLNGMPFMPEMLRYCGQRFRISKVAHKTCDTIRNSGGRRLERTVHLEDLRCDGAGHGGCEAGCLLFWNEAWLKPSTADVKVRNLLTEPNGLRLGSVGSEPALEAGTRRRNEDRNGADRVWQCQTTRLLGATQPLNWWDLRQYIADVTTGNHRLGHMVRILTFGLFRAVVGLGVGYRALVGTYDAIQRWRGKPGFPELPGLIPMQGATPTEILDLQPGELAQVKSHQEIRETLRLDGMNRGMRFDAEMVKYCGQTFRVKSRVTRIIDEKTGIMRRMQNPCIVLNDVYCRAECTAMRLGCPRAVNTYWREIWLRRVAPERGAALAPSPNFNDKPSPVSR